MTENIKVLVRIKPLPPGAESCLRLDPSGITVIPPGANTTKRRAKPRSRLSFAAEMADTDGKRKNRSDTAPINLYPRIEPPRTVKPHKQSANEAHNFQFDHIFGDTATQPQVFSQVKPFLSDAVKGFNASIFAYGQTGSGKTFTMMGEPEEKLGVIPRAIKEIFGELNEEGCPFSVKLSFVELHLDKFIDLLDPYNDPNVQKKMLPQQIIDKERKKKIDIRQNGKEIFLSGSQTLHTPVKTYEETMVLIEQGQRCRSVAKTSLNSNSSRSHAIITLIIERKVGNTKTRGKLHLVDLAGNERLSKSHAQGETMKETQNINASLEALANVMFGLATKQQVIRYRDSKLTRFLQDSLGGNSKTCFIINIRSNAEYYRETIQSLKYGQRAKLIKNSASVTVHGTTTTDIDSSEEVKLLKEKLKATEAELQSQISENKQLRRRLNFNAKEFSQQSQQYQRKISNLIHSQATQLAENRYQYLNLQSNIGAYRKQIYDLTCEISQLQQKNYVFSSTSQQAQGEVQVLQENTEILLKQRDELLQTIETLKEQLQDLQNSSPQASPTPQKKSKPKSKLKSKSAKKKTKVSESPVAPLELSELSEQLPTPKTTALQDEPATPEHEFEDLKFDSPGDDESFEALSLQDLDDDFRPTATPKPKSGKRKGKQTPKVILRKRTSNEFFNLEASEDQDDDSASPTVFSIAQVKPVAKKRRINTAQTVALTLHNKTPSRGRAKPDKKLLKNFFGGSTTHIGSRLELVEDKENFNLMIQ